MFAYRVSVPYRFCNANGSCVVLSTVGRLCDYTHAGNRESNGQREDSMDGERTVEGNESSPSAVHRGMPALLTTALCFLPLSLVMACCSFFVFHDCILYVIEIQLQALQVVSIRMRTGMKGKT